MRSRKCGFRIWRAYAGYTEQVPAGLLLPTLLCALLRELYTTAAPQIDRRGQLERDRPGLSLLVVQCESATPIKNQHILDATREIEWSSVSSPARTPEQRAEVLANLRELVTTIEAVQPQIARSFDREVQPLGQAPQRNARYLLCLSNLSHRGTKLGHGHHRQLINQLTVPCKHR